MHPDSPLAPLANKLTKWSTLGRAELEAVYALPFSFKQIAPHKMIVREGDRPTHCCLLVSGFSIRQKIVARGGRQIVNVNIPGDMVDLQNSLLKVADHDVETLTEVSAAFIPREAIEDLAFARPRVGKALWLETLVDGSITREWAANIGRRNAKTRVAHLLCEFAMRLDSAGLGEQCNYELPMTQEQIADATGLTSVHVNRTLRALDADGLTQRHKRSVVITDWKRMAKIADFHPNYLHLGADSPL
ncbi:Crp/Fnr family transcriptional regulator [Sphingosinicella rhizophila]|uniref:Crp/Fnr family transcriptional regulator n=1 Tax=Sphingosinicella rhizophila TaxID=3050082 RepID=A0ABU3Q7C2_9SPHN|nr:Crp/Fnr family transcriptional regulator [Sphingosinicella sp. GR2756]MDT9599295.1 Crp/Fnr family transcriptional regulator [Sphingosinicella sp. GR2756]